MQQMWWGGVHGGGEQTPAVAEAARARSQQRPGGAVRGHGATVRRRVQELMRLEAAARARGALTLGRQGLAMAEKAEAGRAEAGGAGEAGRDTRVQAAGQQRMSGV